MRVTILFVFILSFEMSYSQFLISKKIESLSKRHFVKYFTSNTESSSNYQGSASIDSTGSIEFIDIDSIRENEYSVNIKMVKIKAISFFQNKKMIFDSDNPLYSDSKFANAFNNMVAKNKIFFCDRIGKITKTPLQESSFGTSVADFFDYKVGDNLDFFLAIDSTHKVGDRWLDSTCNNKIKKVTKFQFKSFDKEKKMTLLSQEVSFLQKDKILLNGEEILFAIEGNLLGFIKVNSETMIIESQDIDGYFTYSSEIKGQRISSTLKTHISIIIK